MSSNKEKLAQLSNAEKFIVVVIVFFGVVSIAAFTCSLISYFIANKNQDMIDGIITTYENGMVYTDGDCFTCTEVGCGDGTPPTTPCIMILEEFRIDDFLSTEVAKTTPMTVGVVEFPASTKTGATIGTQTWFSEQIRVMPGSDILLTDKLFSNTINALQIGTFDYNNETSSTSVCNRKNAVDGSVYYAVDPVERNNRYICICVEIPPIFVDVAESCVRF